MILFYTINNPCVVRHSALNNIAEDVEFDVIIDTETNTFNPHENIEKTD